MDSNDLLRLQQTETEIMDVVDVFCREHDIPYTLYCGTALGAVRHGGFIPWDDDVDICIERAQYERFLELWSENPVDGYFLQGTRDCDVTTINHTKIRKDNTVFAGAFEHEREGAHHGIWIDIFPLDRVPKKKSLRKKLLFRAKLRLVYTRGYPITKRGKALELLSKMMLAIPKRMQKRIKNKSEKAVTKYADTTLDFDYMSLACPEDLAFIYPKTLFDGFTRVKFGDREYSLTTEYDAMLRANYGDYMELPPEEDRKPLHDPEVLIFDVAAQSGGGENA
ncbi:MAG: LicD family protein [Roseburia sp.]|nr:LicD family protein [Roseburia sp.]